MPIGRMEKVPLDDIWDEEEEFTRWLKDHIGVLNDALSSQENKAFNLYNVETEKSAGAFFADMVAEDDWGNKVIIENQFGKSDHDHLGKLITYLTTIEAKTAIWIASEPRQEHADAISWLNKSHSQLANFYLLKLEAFKIDNSPPAPLLTLMVEPGEPVFEEEPERNKLRFEFWTELLERAKGKTDLFANIKPNKYSWIGTGTGISRVLYQFTIREHDGDVQLYIGKAEADENKAIFDKLNASKRDIESEFGGELEWLQSDGKACYILKTISGGYRDNEGEWPRVQNEMINAMISLEGALRQHIENLQT